MKLAIYNETFRHHDFPGTCAEAARHGYNGLEIAPFTLGNPATLTLADAEKLGSIVRDHGLETVGFPLASRQNRRLPPHRSRPRRPRPHLYTACQKSFRKNSLQHLNSVNSVPSVVKISVLENERTFGKWSNYARHLAELCSAMGGRIMVWGCPQQRTLAPEWSRPDAEAASSISSSASPRTWRRRTSPSPSSSSAPPKRISSTPPSARTRSRRRA